MMKRTLSFLLCLIMVLGLAAPSVQATDTDDVYSNIMDNIVVEDGSNVEVVFEDTSVNTSEPVKLPNPSDLLPESTEPPYTFGAPVVEAPVAEVGCQCVDLSSAVKHPGVCEVKAPYMELCSASSAKELFAQWGNYTLVEQDFILDYLYEAFPLKSTELGKLLNAPTGSASETLSDGNTVSVEGIPQDGALTVGEADAVKDIVDAYVADRDDSVSPLFSYDVSVQDGEGADWQPDVNVKMELELPSQKLHKNTKVFVVHVDDNGVATTIEAAVTEDGKIAFETPGFSAFYGFTVDFDYNGVKFAIPGMSSIKLSELFNNLEMPLDAAEVVNVEYTDETQLKIEQLEGDWLLTSLKAFTTTEALTMTMADGAVYEVVVSDETYCTIKKYNGYGVLGSNEDGGTLGVVEWYLKGDGNGNAWESTGTALAPGWTEDYDIVVDGTGATNQTFEIVLQRWSGCGSSVKTLYLDLHSIFVKGGANLIFRFGASIVSTATSEYYATTEVRIRQVRGRNGNNANNGSSMIPIMMMILFIFFIF